MVALIAVLGVIALIAGMQDCWNVVASRRDRMAEAWSQVEVELQRRHDLVARLVTTVRGCVPGERGVFEAVMAARFRALGLRTGTDRSFVIRAENALTDALHPVLAIAEHNPHLRDDEAYRQLQQQLLDCQKKLDATRWDYNDLVTEYDKALAGFPWNVLARIFDLTPVPLFETRIDDRVPAVIP